MLEVQNLIKENADFREILSQKPFALQIREDEHFMLLKYSQIDSDFNIEIVRECRGLILDKSDWSVACHPFHKFGNYGESYVPEMDWTSISVQEKIDGSLIKLWWNKYESKWQWSTNGVIDAYNSELPPNLFGIENFGDLIDITLIKMKRHFQLNESDKEWTFLFELCTPVNRVVVPHTDYILYHLATKRNDNGHECSLEYYGLGLPSPKRYPLHSLEDCIAASKELPFNEEGYVAVDSSLNRVKIKSPAYLAVHHLRGEGVVSPKRALDLIRMNEHAEFLNYFPEYKEFFDEMEEKYETFCKKIYEEMELATVFKKATPRVRKDFADWATKQTAPFVLFAFYDDKIETAKEGLVKLNSERLLGLLK